MNNSNKTLLNGNVVVWHYVKDLPRAIEWYSKTLGLKPSDQIDVACFFKINENTKLALSNRFKADKDNGLPVSSVLDLQTDDIVFIYQMLKSQGVNVEELTNPLHTYHEFYFRDLDNNQIRIHGFVQRSEEIENQADESDL